jgi:hypothetical protein
MHHTVGVAVVERLEKLKDVITNIIIREGGIQDLEVRVVNVFEDEGRGLGLRIAYNVEQLDNVGTATHVLKDLDLPLNLLLLDGLEYFDDALGRVHHVHALEDFTVLPSADLADDLVLLLIAPVHSESLVIPVVPWAMDVDIGVNSVKKSGKCHL